MMPRFLGRAQAVIAVSEFTKRDAIRLYGLRDDKITVIYEGVHPRFVLSSPAQVAAIRRTYHLPEHVILYTGTIEPRKNLARLLEAYARLRSQPGLPGDLKLVIVGKKGWLYQPFFDRLGQLGLQDEVIFPGFVPGEDLPALYGAANVFAYPSLFEGFGLPVLEAMACGTPVVCSTSSSLPEVAGDAALLVDPADTAGLANALQRVLSDSSLRSSLSARGTMQAARFTWEQAARATVAVYEHVMEGST